MQLGADWPTDAQLAAVGIAPLQGEGDFAFAEAVAAFQAGHALNCDGIVGKLTGAALRGVAAPISKEGEQDRSRCLALAADARRWIRGRVVHARADVRRRGTIVRATLPPMTRGLAAIKQSIEALPMDDKAQLLEAVMTPQMRLRLLVNQVRRRGDGGADRHVDRVVNRAVKRVRRAAGTR
jgi:hypothetical protein